MNRKNFLASAWKFNIKPILLPFILVCFALVLIKSDLSEFSGLSFNWSSFGQFFAVIGNVFVAIIRESWIVLLLVLIPLVVFGVIERRVSPEYHKLLKRLRNRTVTVIVTGIVVYYGIIIYQREEYIKLIWLAILLTVNLIIAFTIKEPKPE